jgi:hypothetical protein
MAGREVGRRVTVEDLLSQGRTEVLDEAFAGLERCHVAHYELSGEDFTRERLAELFDIVTAALGDRELAPVSTYAERVAEQRFVAGFGISEVQTAFNVVEEAMWRHVVAGLPADELAEAVGLLGTILGFGKDALARTYVTLASHRRVPSLDLSALFSGVDA